MAAYRYQYRIRILVDRRDDHQHSFSTLTRQTRPISRRCRFQRRRCQIALPFQRAPRQVVFAGRGRPGGTHDVEMKSAASVVREDKENIQNAKVAVGTVKTVRTQARKPPLKDGPNLSQIDLPSSIVAIAL